ncbi:hypothetical protein A2311_05875 [candidate division WOR-1 bacterium RIFOXYB2_FULL_48_7]|uniref:LysM domain-containing protein n=1 Tax=candidate division WOR-1 bacterium RIFOXYB2_FULL_48_7 TaxID=1802583 RepID=A0A1F4T9M3_UNCSA|nr:MAG: hypothetical protein A2311_05875 [candidate division WOR-1 bacterium RIFOXYB2_FULL_48_7]
MSLSTAGGSYVPPLKFYQVRFPEETNPEYLANKFGIQRETLLRENPEIATNQITIGQMLVIRNF